MGEFKFSCTHCGQHIAADDAWAGAEIQCPTCGGQITVPRPASSQAPAGLRISKPMVSADSPPPQAHAAPAAEPVSAPVLPARSARRGQWSGLAISSFVTAILGVPLASIICGHLALGRFKRDASLKGKWMAFTGLGCGYLTLLASVVFVGLIFVAQSKLEQMAEAIEAEGMNVEISSGEGDPFPGGSESSAAPPPPASEIPATPVSGTIVSQQFQCDTAELQQGGILNLVQGDAFDSDAELVVFLFLGQEPPAGRSWVLPGSEADFAPHVHLHWKADGRSESHVAMGNYSLRLEFGQPSGGKIPGKIYFSLEEPYEVEVSGSFEALMK